MQGVHHTVASISRDLPKGIVLPEMHHCRGIGNTTVVAVSERRHVALTHVFDHLQQVGLDIELRRFACTVVQDRGGRCLGLAQRVIVTALGAVSFAVCLSLKQFVSEDAIAPTTIIVKQGQRADGLVENIEVSSVKQQTLCSQQGFASNLEGTGCSGISRIGRTRIFLQVDENLIFNNRAARCGAQSLISSTLSGILVARISPEAVTIKLHSLPGLLGKVMHYHGFNRHLDDITGMGSIELST